MRWREGESGLNAIEMMKVEDQFSTIIAVTQEQMAKYGIGEQYKKLILANGFAGACDGAMQYSAAEKAGKVPSIGYEKFMHEKIKLGVLEGIANIRVQSPPVAKRVAGRTDGNQRHR